VVVDEPDRIAAVLPRVTELVTGGLVTVERARSLGDDDAAPSHESRLTVYLGRGADVRAVVSDLRTHGVEGTTALLGVDGLLDGTRRRARFLGRNGDVPLLLLSVGSDDAFRSALPALRAHAGGAVITVERIQICKRDGVLLTAPRELPQEDEDGLALWQRLTVYASEQLRHERHPAYVALIRALREAGAAGATAVRGVWGYSGEHAPHGDRLRSVRRRVPVVTTLVDRPDRIQRWFELVDAHTDEGGLVTSEIVPAYHAVAAGTRRGGLDLSRPPRVK
jgi:PII-like signaling protein